MVQEVLKEYTAGTIDDDAAAAVRSAGYRRAFDELPLRGMGNLVKAESCRGNVSLRIDNPFSGVMLAGMIRGVYKAVEGADGWCDWAIHPDGYMVVNVTPGG
jgi:hypothetical protein